MSQKNRTGGGAPKVPPAKPKPKPKATGKRGGKRPKAPPEEEAVVSRAAMIRHTGRGGRGR